MSYFLGIDTSTTATKALLMNADGQVAGVAVSEYTYETPRPMWSEQHPALWWKATAESVHQVLSQSGVNPAEVTGVGLTGQMHGLVVLDGDAEVLRPAILWNDQRTGAECDEIRARLGKERFIQITGNDALTGFTAPKILWVKNNEPDIFAQIRQILLPKDYVRFKLTGTYAMDKAGGSGTVLFDVRERNWSTALVEALGIDPAWLPPTFEGPAVTGHVTPQAAQATGLKAGTPVVGGGGDQAAAAVGTGAVVEGIVSLSLGTSGVVFASADRPIIEPQGRLHAFCHAVPGKWHLMGVMLSAAGSLRWYRDTLAPGTDFDTLLEPAAAVPSGSDGIFFLPYLTGERTPHPDPLARGAFVGLTVRHTHAHLTRAVLEGVAYGLRDGFELMKGAGLADITQVRVTGGGAKSPLWRQILADVLCVELVTVNATEGAAYGAAVLAATGLGAFPNVPAACADVVQVTGRTAPGAARAIYQDLYPLYRDLYPALRPSFNALAQIKGEISS
ncbi:MAG: xylulokinase [Thermoflexales bacterium]|nr:xylulokinase [Thermoflexales bacterium]